MADQPTDPNEQDPNVGDHPSPGDEPGSTGEQTESDAQGSAPGSDPDAPEPGSDAQGEPGETGESSSSSEAASAPAMSDAAASLLAAAKAAVSKASSPQEQPGDDPVATSPSDSGADGVEMSNDDIAAMMAQAEQESQAAPRASGSPSPPPDGATPFEPPVLDIDTGASDPGAIDLLAEVHLNVQIELGRTRMLIEDVLSLGDGAVVELDKLAGDPVDVYVNDRLIARGEVLVLNDNFCVRISEICDAEAAGARSQSA